MMDIQSSLFRIGANILIYIFQEKNTSMSEICSNIELVPTTVMLYIDIFEKKGFITTDKQNKTKIIKITEKGKKIAKKLKIIMEELRN